MAKLREQLIIKAEEALNNKEVKIFKDEKAKTIPSEFNGYISAFGAAIIQSGLLPAMAFYMNKKSQPKSERGQLINAIAVMLDKADGNELFTECKKLQEKEEQLDVLKRKIIESAIALKLVIRTYKLV